MNGDNDVIALMVIQLVQHLGYTSGKQETFYTLDYGMKCHI